jgi:NAD(P)-dependent dehydrogenase (short-subunit alcohol dehydrogenase family)
VWFVTGASSGLGAAMARAALTQGDTVVAAARSRDRVDAALSGVSRARLWPVELDVTGTEQTLADTVAAVLDRHGRIDVLVNNAGHGQVGAVEETTDAELRALFDLHVFGPATLTRLVLPGMRARATGAIVQVSSFGGQVAYPGFGAYCATKFALEGLSESLAAEVAPFGIRVLIVEPGAFRTRFGGAALHRSTPMPAYDDAVGPTRALVDGMDGTQPGDPDRAAQAILLALAARTTPLRLPLGVDAVEAITARLARVHQEIRQWQAVSTDTAFPPRAAAEATAPGSTQAPGARR